MNLLTYKGYTVIVRKHGIVIQNGDGREIFHTIGKIKYKDYTENELKQMIENFLMIQKITNKAFEEDFGVVENE